MGAMMSGVDMTAWLTAWILLGLAAVAGTGFALARVLGRRAPRGQLTETTESPAVRRARDALRLRYANGELSREEYLQGKVELED